MGGGGLRLGARLDILPRPVPFARLVTLVFALEALLIVVAIAIGIAVYDNPKEPFGEDGFMTWVSAVQLLAIAFVARRIHAVRKAQISSEAYRASSSGLAIWFIVFLGFLFLTADEVLKIHENLDKSIHDLFGLEQTGLTDRIDDLLVGLYGVIGLGVLYVFRGELRRYREALPFFVAGFVLLFTMVGFDLLTNQDDILSKFLSAERVPHGSPLARADRRGLQAPGRGQFLARFPADLAADPRARRGRPDREPGSQPRGIARARRSTVPESARSRVGVSASAPGPPPGRRRPGPEFSCHALDRPLGGRNRCPHPQNRFPSRRRREKDPRSKSGCLLTKDEHVPEHWVPILPPLLRDRPRGPRGPDRLLELRR